VILSSALIKQRGGEHADEFARARLFEPLGIERTRWFRNDEGHPHTGGGLDLRSRDMARFGLLYLRDGRWGDRQVVPASWVARSLSRVVRFERPRGRSVGYGYWWWVFPPLENAASPATADAPGPRPTHTRDIYAACGFRGQYIFLVPEHDMVVVVTAGGRGWSEERAPRDFLYTDILPSIR
jgi:CubicO group peptidase (beta-lactamase class C family)